MPENIITEIPVTIYGNLEKYSDTISKARCRIFYKGLNRNGTYITEEFAQKLLASVPYTPVKGIFDSSSDDFTDHGKKRSQGRIFGIVPEKPNVAWETILDDDGVERTYACVDVLIYTALYLEAGQIVGKSQSMELYPKTLKGNYQFKEGKRCYVFEDGCFLGLQILGDDVEPCFEGAAFYSLGYKEIYSEMKRMVEQFEKFNLNSQNGGKKMLNYKLSDGAKFNALWSLLNVNYNEAGEWRVDYDICEIYDQYAVVKNYSEGIWERVFYNKNDETDSVEITQRARCYIMDVSETEKNALDALHKLNGENYEKVDENYSAVKTEAEQASQRVSELEGQVSTYEVEKTNFESKIEELNTTISTLTTERDNINTQYTEAETKIEKLTEEVDTLNSFKLGVEKAEKEKVIEKYSEKLNGDTIQTYVENMDKYTVTQLDKELAYELVSTDSSIFSKQPESRLIPTGESSLTGIEQILSKYKK